MTTSSWDVGSNRLWLTTEITCSCLEYTMFIKINIQCKFLILFLSLPCLSVTMHWCLLDRWTHAHTRLLVQHLWERYTAPYLFQKTKTKGPNHPCVHLLASPQHISLPAQSLPAGPETGRLEGKELGVGKGILQWAGMGKGCIWSRWGTISRLKQKSCSPVHKTFFHWIRWT